MHSIFSCTVRDGSGNIVSMDNFKGKKLMIVNTASECGLTPQYGQLQELYAAHRSSGLEIIAFPSDDFAHQEPLDDAGIANFCSRNYGVTFPIMAKSAVLGPEANAVFRWLGNPQQNGKTAAVPEWNFAKFLINRDGALHAVVAATETPFCDLVLEWINTDS